MALLLLIPAVAALALTLAVLGLTILRRRRGLPPALRGLAALAGAAAAALYTWGLLFLGSAVLDAEDGGTDSAPIRPCRLPDRREEVMRVVDYTIGYLPPRFVCEMRDGDSYTTGHVPGYVAPGVAVAALTGAGLAIAAGFVAEHHARRTPGRP
ncbi:hypothetical protein ACFVIM_12155 [Streptomyces sp. NPDC057638]|uniref:hypothetical protein n=1 Tax=Streptomyces sp. NPDC057638 TaxID=3346190 RepID=UPI0036B2FB0B